MAQTYSLAGKVAIVTGSSSGIGLATVVKLAALGAKVTVHGRNPDGIAEAKKKCIAAGLKETDILTVAGEITQEDTRKRLIDETVKQFGKLDILVNNHGASPFSSIAMGNATLDTFDKVFDINVRSVIDLSMKAVPHLVKTKGNIVNVSSVGGMRPVPRFMFYCMAKSSVEMFSRAMAQELGSQGVRVNTVSPGLVRTNLPASAGIPKEGLSGIYDADVWKKRQALGRVGEPEDLANLIAFLVSPGASWITGSNYVEDGGLMVNHEGYEESQAKK